MSKKFFSDKTSDLVSNTINSIIDDIKEDTKDIRSSINTKAKDISYVVGKSLLKFANKDKNQFN